MVADLPPLGICANLHAFNHRNPFLWQKAVVEMTSLVLPVLVVMGRPGLLTVLTSIAHILPAASPRVKRTENPNSISNHIMPNRCQNQLTVTGATPEFRAWLEKEGFSFEKMNPPRKPRKSTRSNRPILDSHCNAWGTKWDLDDKEQRKVANELLDHGSAAGEHEIEGLAVLP